MGGGGQDKKKIGAVCTRGGCGWLWLVLGVVVVEVGTGGGCGWYWGVEQGETDWLFYSWQATFYCYAIATTLRVGKNAGNNTTSETKQ